MSEELENFGNPFEEKILTDAKAELEQLNKDESVSSILEHTEERQFTELEKEQMEKGWDPNKEDGVSAKEFKRVGEIIEAKRLATKKANIANREVEELTKTVKVLVEQNRAVEKATREKTLLEVNKRKIEAEENGDIQAYKVAVMEEAAQRALPPIEEVKTPEPLDPSVIAFQEENKEWLTGTKPGDVAMQAYVKARVEFYMKHDPNIDPKVAVNEIKVGLEEEFPNKFSNSNKTKPALTMKSTTSSLGSASSYSRLNSQQREEFDLIKKVDSSYTLKEYTDQLILVGKLDK